MEHEFTIDTDEIKEYLLVRLTAAGYCPTDKELDDMADIFFDFLISKTIIDEEDVDEIDY